MIRFPMMLIFVSSMASIAMADDPDPTDPRLVLERLNAQLTDQAQKLGARIEECDAIMKRIQTGEPIQIGSESSPFRKMPLPYCVPAAGPKPEALEMLEFRMPPVHTGEKQEKVFLQPVDELPNFIRRFC